MKKDKPVFNSNTAFSFRAVINTSLLLIRADRLIWARLLNLQLSVGFRITFVRTESRTEQGTLRNASVEYWSR